MYRLWTTSALIAGLLLKGVENVAVSNKVQLITYPDSLGENLSELHYVLRRYLRDAVGGVHILPFYPSSADRGFAPLTYTEVDSRFGSHDDIKAIAEDFDLVIDFMINHISRQSVYFQDYIQNGDQSQFADMFRSFKKLAATSSFSDDDLKKVYTRKARPPYCIIERPDGSKEKVWCTFDYEQIDLDWNSSKTRQVMRNFLLYLFKCKPKMIRLDAFAYTTVKSGTNCFFLEPEVWELLQWVRNLSSVYDVELLPEVHEHYSYQLKIEEKGYWAYDFSLPMLVLHALYFHTNRYLTKWLNICPRRQVTTLDTHDGIGIVDVVDLLPQEEVEATVQCLYDRGSNVKKRYSGAEFKNLDIYQVNCTFFSALGCNDDAYIAARAIQFFAPGTPQVYYVGLMAGQNDIELVERTKHGRDINRHFYSIEEIETEMSKEVVQRLLIMMHFRSNYPAFDGQISIDSPQDEILTIKWSNSPAECQAVINLTTYQVNITYFDFETNQQNGFVA
jgi:sucrose phosphorylase